jgi:hypothetical protein
MLPFLQLGEDPRLLAFPLETPERILERFVFFDVNERHLYFPPFFVSLLPGGILTPRRNGGNGLPHSE